jgi:hypothetical protein
VGVKVGMGVGDGVEGRIHVGAEMDYWGGGTGVVTELRAGICVGGGVCARWLFKLGCSSWGVVWFPYFDGASLPTMSS